MNICVIGTGYVGLVTAACFSEMGNHVVCVDNNTSIVNLLKKGKVQIFEHGLEEMVMRNSQSNRLVFTIDLKEGLANAEVVFICVGTPSKEDGSCDLTSVEQVARDIGKLINGSLIVVDKSTVPVGTADRVKKIISEEQEKRGSSHFFTVMSNPEFLKEGDAIVDFMKPDRVVIGTEDMHAAEVIKLLYAPFARSRDKVIIMSTRSAEMTKYAANCMLATKISFINEIANICEKSGADVQEIRAGIGSDHRIGHFFIYPGIGYGGSCFPKDVKALIHTSHTYGIIPDLLEAVERVNFYQKKIMAKRIIEYFDNQGGVSGKTLAMWGLSFKANTDDMREAPSISIIEELTARGMRICAYDPEASSNADKIFAKNSLVHIVDNQYKAILGANALLVATEWNQFRNPDFDQIKSSLTAPVLFDGRNLYTGMDIPKKGFAYFCIGKSNDKTIEN